MATNEQITSVATLQDVFNLVWERALDKRRSATIAGTCRYRLPDSEHTPGCFAGCLVTDSEYDPTWEGTSFSGLFDTDYRSEPLGNPPERLRPFRHEIRELQRIHDIYQPEDWEGNLTIFAAERGLKVPGVE